MLRKILVLIILVVLQHSCFRGPENIPEPRDNPHVLKPGKYVPAKGEVVDMDSVAKPKYYASRGRYVKAGRPEYIPEKKNYYITGESKYITAKGQVINVESVSKPEYISSKGKRVPSSWPEWTPAQPGLSDDTRFHFSYLNVEHGLNFDYIHCLLEDSEGKIWMAAGGTVDVSVWDGAGFTKYTKAEGLNLNVVWCMMEDREGKIWLGGNGGVCVWDGTGFIHYGKTEGLNKFSIRSLMQDQSGKIWIGSYEGVSVWDGQGFTHYTTQEGLCNNMVFSLLEDREGKIWIGTNGGVSVWDGSSFTNYTTEEGHFWNAVKCLLEDDQGRIWIGTSGDGVGIWDGFGFRQFKTRDGLTDNNILSLWKRNNGEIWIGTYKGVSVWDKVGFTHYTVEEGLSSGPVYDLIGDRNGNIWIATFSGVSIWSANNFSHYTPVEGLSNHLVSSLLEDQEGNIWIGTEGGGLNMWDGTGFRHYTSEQGLINDVVHCLLEDRDGNIWIGTKEGLSVWDKVGFTHYTIEEGLGSRPVWDLLEDRNGNIWIGTFYGVSVWDGFGFTRYTMEEGLDNNFVKSILEYRDGSIWLGYGAGGLSNWDGYGFTLFTNEDLDNNLVSTSLLKDAEGKLWIGTFNGIRVWDGAGFTQYTTKEGLSNNVILKVYQKKGGDIWLGTNKGLNRLSSTKEKGVMDIQVIHNQDGLQGITINDILLDRKNRLWLGTKKGLNRIDLDSYNSDTSRPTLFIRDLQLSHNFIDWRQTHNAIQKGENPVIGQQELSLKKVDFDSVIPFKNLPLDPVFSHDFDQLMLSWQAIHWSAPHKIQYSYLLEGRDRSWSPLSKENKIIYRDLRPGDYTFKVRAVGGNGLWSDTAAYAFYIRPPWWLAGWAYGLYTFVSFLVLTGLYLYQRRRWLLQTQLQLEQEKAERFREMDQFKSRFYTNITHEFRTPLTIIKGMAGQISGHKKIKSLIGHNSDRLLNLINQMLDLSKLEANNLAVNWVQGDIIPFIRYLTESCHSMAENKSLNLTFSSRVESLVMDYDENKLRQIIINLLSNALKFTSEGGRIDVIATQVHEKGNPYLELAVKDTGKGIPQEQLPHIFDRFYQVDNSPTRQGEGSGIGLSLVKELIRLLDGRIEVESKPDKGSIFVVYLPVHRRVLAKPTWELSSLSPRVISNSATESKMISNSPSFKSKKPLVLTIEDNHDVVEYIQSCLVEDYDLQAAFDGKEGVQRALESIPDVIICDVMMPEMDGFEVCRLLKSNRMTSHIPIILLTAKATQEDKISGLTQGADAYLTKPFDQEELKVRLKNLTLQSKRLRDRLLSLVDSDDLSSELEEQEVAFLKELHQIILSNLDNELLDPDFLCRSLAVSRSQLFRKLKALTGQSPASSIRSIRLQKARSLLTTTNLTIGEIALQVGFKDFSHFSRSFFKAFDQKPSDIRK